MSIIIIAENDLQKVHAGHSVGWSLKVNTDALKITFSFRITTGPNAEDSPEWSVYFKKNNDEIWNSCSSKTEVEVDFSEKDQYALEVTCPDGARYDDTVSITVNVSTKGEICSKEFTARATQSIMVLKTQIDHEKSVVDSLSSKANIGQKDIYAILSPATLRGYVFVEGMNTDCMREKIKDIRKARSFITDKKRSKGDQSIIGETTIEDIDHYLMPLSTVVGIVEGDLVELVNGPFKGEKARVQQIDQSKEEITVELIEAMVPIPITVKGDSVRIIEKER
ncbi:MAG: transcription elongation factor Spt5 [archaeon]|nr:transcription elongation factor Spt5 [archaeon]